MPMTPGPDEKESEFISRCIKEHVDKGRPQDQAAAICYSYWEKDTQFKRWDDERKMRNRRNQSE